MKFNGELQGLWLDRLPEQVENAKEILGGQPSQPISFGFRGIPAMVTCRLPTLGCGMLQPVQCKMLVNGVNEANDGPELLSIAHLYKACRYYCLVGEWHDMDFIFANHEVLQPLVTKTNATADPHAIPRHYYIALGGSATAFASSKTYRPEIPSRRRIGEKGRSFRPKLTLTKGISDAAINSRKRHGGRDTDWDSVLNTVARVRSKDCEADRQGALPNSQMV